jgi:hypothetical protein
MPCLNGNHILHFNKYRISKKEDSKRALILVQIVIGVTVPNLYKVWHRDTNDNQCITQG